MSEPSPPRRARRQDALPLSELPWRLPVTFAIGLLTLLFFVLEYQLGGTTDIGAQMRLGALRPDRVTEHGELYRLFMPMLLHHGPIHLVMNGIAYIQLMLLTEYLYGSVRALVFYVLCGLGAALTTTFLAPPWIGGSVGASGAIMGLAGLLLGASWYGREPWRSRLRRMFGRRLAFGVLLTFAIGIGISWLVPIVDNWGHGGGFATGMAIAALHRDPRRRHGRVAEIGAGALAAAWVAAIGWTAVDGEQILRRLDRDNAEIMAQRAALNEDGSRTGVYLAEMVRAFHRAGAPREGRRMLRERLELATDPRTPMIVAHQLFQAEAAYDRELAIALERWVELAPEDPEALNALAWHLVTRDRARRDPVRAEALSRGSLELLDAAEGRAATQQRAAYLDTHAEALYQLGRYDEALQDQREAVRLAEGLDMAELPEMRERLARIETALSPG